MSPRIRVSIQSQVLGYGLPSAVRDLVERHQSNRARTTADKSLARRLRAGIQSAGLPISGLAFYVSDGAMSLYGIVPDAQAREDVVAIASAQPGVRRIVDHLRLADA